MKFICFTLLFLMTSFLVLGQIKMDHTLRLLNTETVPYAYVNEVKSTKDITILDTRKKEEFEVSHIKNAIWVGYKSFKQDSVLKNIPNKNAAILVYCSIGVRSEDIGEKLQEMGYTKVKNLYGGIFEWKNQGNSVYKNNTTETDSIHTYNKHWGKLLKKGIKVIN